MYCNIKLYKLCVQYEYVLYVIMWVYLYYSMLEYVFVDYIIIIHINIH